VLFEEGCDFLRGEVLVHERHIRIVGEVEASRVSIEVMGVKFMGVLKECLK